MKRIQTSLPFIPVRRSKENELSIDGEAAVPGKRHASEQLQSDAKRVALQRIELIKKENGPPSQECGKAQLPDLRTRPSRDRRNMLQWCVVMPTHRPVLLVICATV